MTKFNLQSPLHGFAVKYSYGGDNYEYTTVKASNGTFNIEIDLVDRGDTEVDQFVFESASKSVYWDGELNGEADLIAVLSGVEWVPLRKLATDLIKAVTDERDDDVQNLSIEADCASRHAIRMSSPFLTGRI